MSEERIAFEIWYRWACKNPDPEGLVWAAWKARAELAEAKQ